ncbi:hypothetical protein [Pseudoclavibacter sp. 13-3]|uniref:hypothetical protein n=1 Tax=Pseudoclavibacter sp. 13-3 TaxID=2901228 RepID=UPI001E2EFBEE|nr:hypothetical protein [Pseudoclavibacter sp. 13-3]MCD7100470.1 hypothetical protein [Pseudoclavibacter sp. 13-3]
MSPAPQSLVARPGDVVVHAGHRCTVHRVTVHVDLGLTAVLHSLDDPALILVAPLASLEVLERSAAPVDSPALLSWAHGFLTRGPRSSPLVHGDAALARALVEGSPSV